MQSAIKKYLICLILLLFQHSAKGQSVSIPVEDARACVRCFNALEGAEAADSVKVAQIANMAAQISNLKEYVDNRDSVIAAYSEKDSISHVIQAANTKIIETQETEIKRHKKNKLFERIGFILLIIVMAAI